jgi:hypothetical protein
MFLCRALTRNGLLFMASIALFPSVVWAFNQPPVNLTATTFLDGGGAPSGWYLVEYVQFVEGREARDRKGNKLPGDARVNVLAHLNQIYYQSSVKILGGYLAGQVLLPVVTPSAKGSIGPIPITANTGGLGDIVAGPALQWNDSKLFGAPFFHRFEVDFTFPTGKYDKNMSVNSGSNILTVDPYYAFTWFPSRNLETSFRLWYAFHGENDETKVKPGRLFHMNYAASYQAHPRLRLGAAGYYLQQTTEDEVAGVKSSGSKERAFALGPGLVYMGQGLTAMLSHPVEFGVRNRFKGSRTTLQLIHKF